MRSSNKLESKDIESQDQTALLASPQVDNSDSDLLEEGEGSLIYAIFCKISSLSLPMALSYTFSIEMFLLTLMLTYLNPDDDKEVAATVLIATMANSLSIIGMSPLFCMSLPASEDIGALVEAEKNNEDPNLLSEKRDYISAYNRNGLLISSLVSPVVMSSFYFSKSILVNLFDQNEESSEIAQQFLRLYSLATPGLMSRMCFEQIMFSFGKPKPAMQMGLLSLGVGSLLSATLGFGWAGKKMGSTGIAIGFVFEAYLTAIFYGLYIARNSAFKNFHFFNFLKNVKNSWSQLKKLISNAKSVTLGIATEMAITLATTVIAGLVGTREQASLTSAMQAVFFSFIPLSAFGQACSQEVSREIGAKRYQLASSTGRYGLLTSLLYSIPLPLACAVEPRIVMLVGGGKQEILRTLMPIISVGITSDSVRYNLLQQLRALDDFNVSTVISVAGLTIGIASSAVLGLKTDLGITGVGVGYTTGIVISAAGLGLRWRNLIQPDAIQRKQESKSIQQPSRFSPRLFSNNHQRSDMLLLTTDREEVKMSLQS